MSKFRLPGLRSDILLAFMALLGLLKILDAKERASKPRVDWEGNAPSLYINSNIDEEKLLNNIVDGLGEYSKKMNFVGVKNISDLKEFKKLQDSIDPDIMSVLGSSVILNKKGDGVIANPLCMMFGSGHQNFLERLEKAVHIDNDRNRMIEIMRNALFRTWVYEESDLAFRWDPKEYRPHALRHMDPSKERVMVVEGACRLAAVGFLSYTCVPTSKGLGTISCIEDEIRWPIWTGKMSLATILAVMRLPHIRMSSEQKTKNAMELRQYGIKKIMSARLFWDGKFRNVGNAKRIS